MATATPGQNATFTFTGSAGQVVTIAFTQNTMGSAAFVLKKPDGTTLTSMTTSANASFTRITLPASGQYSILVDPNGTAVGSVTGTITAS